MTHGNDYEYDLYYLPTLWSRGQRFFTLRIKGRIINQTFDKHHEFVFDRVSRRARELGCFFGERFFDLFGELGEDVLYVGTASRGTYGIDERDLFKACGRGG